MIPAASVTVLRIPDSKDVAELDRVMAHYARVVELPTARVQPELLALEKEISSLDSVTQAAIPIPTRVVDARLTLAKAVQKAKDALAKR
jgi:hypothetical protein